MGAHFFVYFYILYLYSVYKFWEQMPIFEPQTVIIIENTVGDISMFSFGLFIPVAGFACFVK